MKFLIINAGSSSQKSCLYDVPDEQNLDVPLSPLWVATIDWTVNDNSGYLTVKANNNQWQSNISNQDKARAMEIMLQTLIQRETKVLDNLSQINIVGHRVVHGGKKYSQATLIDAEVKEAIAKLIPLAPNHNPAHLAGINQIEKIIGQVTQVAVFDTAFHSTIPEVNKVYPLPYDFYRQGIQRYGFHGISHQYVAQRTAQILQQPLIRLNMITCHLGNGCSITAIKAGKSVNTSMGFTPLEGVMMGSRSGSIDPAILIYFLEEYGYDAQKINRILNQESGLLGVSEVSSDVRRVLKAMDAGNPQAQLAIEIYVKRIQEVISSMLPSLGKLDVLVFTAGVGENAVLIREKICQGLGFLGVKLDTVKNSQQCHEINIALPESQAQVIVVPTKEDWAIVQECAKFKKSLN